MSEENTPTCVGLVRYAEKEHAARQAEREGLKGVKIAKCPKCDHFHMTSTVQDEKPRRKRAKPE